MTRPCKICMLPLDMLNEVDASLLAGSTFAEVANRIGRGLNRWSVRRHYLNHLLGERKKSYDVREQQILSIERCIWCQKQLPWDFNQRACSRECWIKYYNQRRPPTTRRCVVCDNEYLGGVRTILCQPCKTQRRKERDKIKNNRAHARARAAIMALNELGIKL